MISCKNFLPLEHRRLGVYMCTCILITNLVAWFRDHHQLYMPCCASVASQLIRSASSSSFSTVNLESPLANQSNSLFLSSALSLL